MQALPENRFEACKPCAKCQMIRFLSRKPPPLEQGVEIDIQGSISPSST